MINVYIITKLNEKVRQSWKQKGLPCKLATDGHTQGDIVYEI